MAIVNAPQAGEPQDASAARDDQSGGAGDAGEQAHPTGAEAAERDTAAGQCEHAGRPDWAGRLRREARILLTAPAETR